MQFCSMKMKAIGFFLAYTTLASVSARAELLHVYQQTIAGTTTNRLSDTVLETTKSYSTQTAPAIDGWIFTHWSISTAQTFSDRDRWGRALDAAPYTLYEETTLTANYLPASQDSDADGVADGWEIYWYGSLAESALSDSDNDGFSFAEELAQGTNPLFADEFAPGGIEWADSALLLYNPYSIQPYTLRSDPEGALFATTETYVRPGTVVTTPSYDHDSTIFAYWDMNGTRQADRWGRALDAVTFTMPSNAVTLTAHTAANEQDKQALYWYGSLAESAPSDSDNDGFSFAEELARGTNPLFADEFAPGGIEWADSALLLYNPFCIQPYIVRSEPEGALFASSTNWVRAGTTVTTETFSPTSSSFAYWTLNGTEQRDRWGRARDSLSFAMPSNEVEMVAHTATDEQDRQALYWYGALPYMAGSDTDGDGFTFAEELAQGTNPLFADEFAPGGIEWADSELLEANLQPFEQLTRGLVDGEAVELFRSNWEKNEGAMNFGTNAAVAVVDANGDGLEDLLVAGSDGAGGIRTTLLLNGGTPGSPDFTVAEGPWAPLAAAIAEGCTLAGALGPDGQQGVYLSGEPVRFFDFATGAFTDTPLSGVPAWYDSTLYALDVASGTVATTNGVLSLDTPVVRGVSLAVADADHDGLADLLVSDEDGRVWFYKNNGDGTWTLRHKVWGGSFGGFAEGLRIAAIDWNADGNLDAVGATADGTLVLLRDPRVGVPANLRLAAGLTSVALEWDPSTQSRVRGYRVYRGPDQTGAFDRLTAPWTPLPNYRDYPGVLRDWWYRVTSVGRFYTTGNSAPTFIESAPTEAQVARLGGIELYVRDANGVTGEEVEIQVAINNSLGMAARDLSFTLEYDPALLEARRVLPSGLTEAVQFTQTAANGRWRIVATGGTVDPGAGTLFTLVFYVKPQHVADATTLAITAATAKSVSGQTAVIPLPVSGTLSIFDSDPPIKPEIAVETCVASVVERETVALPVVFATDRTLDASTLWISGSYDTNRLEWVRFDAEEGFDGETRPEAASPDGASQGGGGLPSAVAPGWIVSGTAGIVPAGTNLLGRLVFRALDVESDMRTAVPVESVEAVSTAGVTASPPPPDPFVVQILNNPAFDPVHATFLPGSASAKIGTEATLPVSVLIDAALDGASWTLSGSYDVSNLEVLGAVSLSPELAVSFASAGGAFTVRGTGGSLAASADAQPLFALRVRPAVQYSTRTTKVSFSGAAAKAADGRGFIAAVGAGGDVAIRFASDTDAPVVALEAWAGEVVERETVSVPVRFTTTETLDRGQFALEGTWDADALEFVRFDAAAGFDGGLETASPLAGASQGGGGLQSAGAPCWRISGMAGVVPEGAAMAGSLVFRAKDVAADAATLVHATGGTAVSTEGLSGSVPEASYSVLVRNNAAYDPAHAVFLPGSSATKVGVATTLPVAVNLDAPLDGAQWSVQGTFDTALLDVTGATAAPGMAVSFAQSGGSFTVRGTGGSLAAASGAQALFTLAVTPKVQYATRTVAVTLRNPSAKTPDGRTFEASVAAGGDIALRFTDSDEPPVVTFRSGAKEVVERERVEVPIVLVTTDTLALSTVRIAGTYTASHLSFVAARSGAGVSASSPSAGTWSISGVSGILQPNSATTLATLVFEALDVESDSTAFVTVEDASMGSADGVAAVVRKPSPIIVTVRNNPAYDPVHATFLPGTASAKIGTEAALPVSVQIDAALDGAAWSVSGTCDATLLEVLGATPLASGLSVSCTVTDGAFTVRGTGGTLAAKATAQPLFALRVKPAVQYTTRATAVAFDTATANAADGREFVATLGNGGNVAIHFSDTDVPPTISFPATSAEGFERRDISVPVKLTTSQALNRGELVLQGSWDANLLDWVRFDAAAGFDGGLETASPQDGASQGGGGLQSAVAPRWRITGTPGVVPAGTATLGSFVFRAKDVVSDVQTQVLVSGGAAVSTEGVAAAGIPSASFVVNVKNDPAFDPVHATFAIGSGTAEIGSVATVKVSATFGAPMNGGTLAAKIKFDAALLSVESVSPHVNGFTIGWSASGGVLTVTGKGGTIPVPGSKLDLFTVSFRLAKQTATHATSLSFASVGAKSADGRTYIVDAATGGSVAITWTEKPRYFKGDVDGDGDLDGDDVRYMQKLVTGAVKPTANEIKAGDFNGDGKITAADYQLLRKYFAEQGIANR